MSYITTASGLHFDPMNPDMNLINIEDIAHALSYMARANGHMKIFYSVAQHSLACAAEAMQRGCSNEVVLGCLLHDASEAYICDLTRPIKKELPLYIETEEALLKVIWTKLVGRDMTDEEKEIIFDIDDDMLSLEFHQLMPEDLGDRYKNLSVKHICKTKDFDSIRKEFVDMYYFIKDKM